MITQAAMKAYMKDVEENPDHSAHLVREKMNSLKEENDNFRGETSAEFSRAESSDDKGGGTSEVKASDSESIIAPHRIWYEAKSDEGHTYYWNTKTNGW